MPPNVHIKYESPAVRQETLQLPSAVRRRNNVWRSSAWYNNVDGWITVA